MSQSAVEERASRPVETATEPKAPKERRSLSRPKQLIQKFRDIISPEPKPVEPTSAKPKIDDIVPDVAAFAPTEDAIVAPAAVEPVSTPAVDDEEQLKSKKKSNRVSKVFMNLWTPKSEKDGNSPTSPNPKSSREEESAVKPISAEEPSIAPIEPIAPITPITDESATKTIPEPSPPTVAPVLPSLEEPKVDEAVKTEDAEKSAKVDEPTPSATSDKDKDKRRSFFGRFSRKPTDLATPTASPLDETPVTEATETKLDEAVATIKDEKTSPTRRKLFSFPSSKLKKTEADTVASTIPAIDATAPVVEDAPAAVTAASEPEAIATKEPATKALDGETKEKGTKESKGPGLLLRSLSKAFQPGKRLKSPAAAAASPTTESKVTEEEETAAAKIEEAKPTTTATSALPVAAPAMATVTDDAAKATESAPLPKKHEIPASTTIAPLVSTTAVAAA